MDHVKYAFIALIGWGFWAIGSKLLTRYFNTLSTTFWISFWSIVFLTLVILFRKNLIFNKYVFYSIPVGIISLVAIISFYKALKIGPSSVVLPLTNLYVILPVLFGFIVLREPVTLVRIAGIVMAILAAVLLSL
ncbi:MAG: EamA family transporter [candidate division WOR-3 bacterium]|nr:EamA family transporter [candidate division WOR-3 bacterium]